LRKNHISFYINRRENHTNRFEKVSQIVLRLVRFTLNALAFESKRLGVFESRLRGLFLRENTIKEERQLIVLDKLPFFLSG
jgi:CRISPR/Cas system CSM-associated protein Csm2 small subunit